ncbi:sugar phosphate isomerase/epimerase family protein [Paenibacillus allorhizosphaerae]|uniref:Inosose dehydratase n=1 Tax=Paenibacillus allorhizosphaerae TaxID=2849866 RepID=A0ABM8VA28_9BACL|nr:sugar phosphate isomerase/epimerase [Paenibacillus allorhizosphaerae]CAG7615272.1 Inosose dehydratase [Paenibacillus allorhizosphaerae]
MKTALFTGVLRDAAFGDVVRLAAEIGYDGLEIRALSHLKPDSTVEEVKEMRRIADHYGLAIPVIYSNISGQYAKATEAEAMQKLELLKRYTEWAAELGATMVCHGPGGPAPGKATGEDFDRAAYWLRQAADILWQGDIRLIMEIHHNGLVETIDSTLKLLNAIDLSHVGAILDPGNMAIAGEEYGAGAVARLGTHLLHVHAKDVRFYEEPPVTRKAGTYGDKIFTVELMGTGHVDHQPAYRALLASGYEGYVSLEAQVADVRPEDIARHEFRELELAMLKSKSEIDSSK